MQTRYMGTRVYTSTILHCHFPDVTPAVAQRSTTQDQMLSHLLKLYTLFCVTCCENLTKTTARSQIHTCVRDI